MALVHNVARLKPRRRELRRGLTIAEASLWKHLKDKSLRGRKLRRPHSDGPYLLGFYCPRERLAVELDGAAHEKEESYDPKPALEPRNHAAGIRLVRFENRE